MGHHVMHPYYGMPQQVWNGPIFPPPREPPVVVRPKIQEGQVVKCDGVELRILKKIGAGSFGSVWGAVEVATEKPVALKEMAISSSFGIEAALYEIEIQKKLSDVQCHAVPQYIAHEILDTPSGHSTKRYARLAMRKVSGVPIDMWLYNMETAKFKDISLAAVGKTPGGAAGTLSLMDAQKAASQLLLQLCPTFDTLDKIAFHRDVNAHNILIDAENDFKYTLIDFGLATDAAKFRADSWRTAGVGGDIRYWSPSCWMYYLWGGSYLESHPSPSWFDQFRNRIDYFAMGSVVCEIFFNGMDLEAAVKESDAPEALRDAHQKFRSFWLYCLEIFQIAFGEGQGRLVEIRPRFQKLQVAIRMEDLIGQALKSFKTLAAKSAQLHLFMLVCEDLLADRYEFTWRFLPGVLTKDDVMSESLVIPRVMKPVNHCRHRSLDFGSGEAGKVIQVKPGRRSSNGGSTSSDLMQNIVEEESEPVVEIPVEVTVPAKDAGHSRHKSECSGYHQQTLSSLRHGQSQYFSHAPRPQVMSYVPPTAARPYVNTSPHKPTNPTTPTAHMVRPMSPAYSKMSSQQMQPMYGAQPQFMPYAMGMQHHSMNPYPGPFDYRSHDVNLKYAPHSNWIRQ